MKVIKKINNNIVWTKVFQGNELLIVGKGLGFEKYPISYEKKMRELKKSLVQNKVLNLYEAICELLYYEKMSEMEPPTEVFLMMAGIVKKVSLLFCCATNK